MQFDLITMPLDVPMEVWLHHDAPVAKIPEALASPLISFQSMHCLRATSKDLIIKQCNAIEVNENRLNCSEAQAWRDQSRQKTAG